MALCQNGIQICSSGTALARVCQSGMLQCIDAIIVSCGMPEMPGRTTTQVLLLALAGGLPARWRRVQSFVGKHDNDLPLEIGARLAGLERLVDVAP